MFEAHDHRIECCKPLNAWETWGRDASSDFTLNNAFCTLNDGLKITMKRPARQAVEAQNQSKVGFYMSHISSKCFQVAPSSAPSPNIHTFVAGHKAQQYPAIAIHYSSLFPAQNLAMRSPRPHGEFNSEISVMREHVLISGRVNSFAWHNLDHYTTGTSNRMQDSLQSIKTVPHQNWIVQRCKQNK